MQNIGSFFFLSFFFFTENDNFSYLSTQNFFPRSNHHSTEFVQHLYIFALNRQCQKLFLEKNVKNMVL